MAKSRNRGGAKAHRKRVQKRNEKLGIQKKQFQKVFTQMYETKMKELQEKFEQLSATTENSELTNDEVNNFVEVKHEESFSTEEKVETTGSETGNN